MHRSGEGFTTTKMRANFMREHNLKDTKANSSFVADVADPSAPLYFWQLHSLLGWAKIEAIVRAFYLRVYADDRAHVPHLLATLLVDVSLSQLHAAWLAS